MKTTTNKTAKVTVAQIVTERLIEQMKAGDIPWRKPWTEARGMFPRNWKTGRFYTGINRILLEPGEYATFKQISEAGGRVNKGAKAEIVTFAKPLIVTDKDSTEARTTASGEVIPAGKKVIYMLRYYKVFNIDDTTLDRKFDAETDTRTPAQLDEIAEAIILHYTTAGHGCKINRTAESDRAFYSLTHDEITVPAREQFDGQTPKYYSTLFHEMTHSTGHHTRLNRFSKGQTSDPSRYAKEELTAEIGASFLRAVAGVETPEALDNSTAYLQHWISQLENDYTLIVRASSQAEKSMNYILGGRTDVRHKTDRSFDYCQRRTVRKRIKLFITNQPRPERSGRDHLKGIP